MLNPLPLLRRLAPLGAALLALAGCSGPQMLKLDEGKFKRRPSIYPIDIYMGDSGQAHRDLAVVDSTAFANDDNETRNRQIEELKTKARALGADAVQEVRILNKQVSGYTVDEQTPFPSWKQGDYVLYFVRGKAVIYESSLPGSIGKNKGFGVDSAEAAPPATKAKGLKDSKNSKSSPPAATIPSTVAPAAAPTPNP